MYKIKTIFILLIVILVTSCDYYQLVYIRNISDKPIQINVIYRWKYNDFNKVKCSDSIISNLKPTSYKKFKEFILIDSLSDTEYTYIQPCNTTSLVEPIMIHHPIKFITYKSKLGNTDTIYCYPGGIRKYKELVKSGIVKRKHAATWIIDIK